MKELVIPYVLHFSIFVIIGIVNAKFTESARIATLKEDYLADSCHFRSKLQLTITIDSNSNEQITLLLTKNSKLNVNAPLYVCDVKNHGTCREVSRKMKAAAHYQDITNGAHVSAVCAKKSKEISTMEYTGTFVLNKDVLSFRPYRSVPEESELRNPQPFTKYYVVQKEDYPNPNSHDYVYNENSFKTHSPTSTTNRLRRRPRSTSPIQYSVDLLLVIDYSIYRRWLLQNEDHSASSEDIQENIRTYYAHVVNGVDVRYQNIHLADFDIRMQIAGYVIVQSSEEYPWTEYRKEPPASGGRTQLSADQALRDFRFWVNTTKGLPVHDHAILFTDYDLYNIRNGEKVLHTSGLAYIGTLCRYSDSVSVVEEQGGFQSVGTTAHEIGHSLGAKHDGEDNGCRSEDRFIMASTGFGPVPGSMKLHPWHFSVCSVDYFRNFIASLLASGSTCLVESSSTSSPVQLSKDLPGQLYPPDDQCKLIWGRSSYLCRGAEFGNSSSICTAMYCRDQGTDSDCVLHTAARGTSCGDKKWCLDGLCVYDDDAPNKHEDCVLGDQPGVAFNGLTCQQLVSMSASYCYQDKVRARCCHSCRQHYTWRKGCEYGDRVLHCSSWHCSQSFENRDILSECCGTCNIGDVISSSTHYPIVTVTPPEIITTECKDYGRINSLSCNDYISTFGVYKCYTETVSKVCCATCGSVRNKADNDCEFGDRSPQLCRNIANATSLTCDRYGHQCCKSCRHDTSGTIDFHTFHTPFLFSIMLYYIVLELLRC